MSAPLGVRFSGIFAMPAPYQCQTVIHFQNEKDEQQPSLGIWERHVAGVGAYWVFFKLTFSSKLALSYNKSKVW